MAGKLSREGPNPGDYVELPSPADIIPIQTTHRLNDAVLLSFPSGKADLHNLTQNDLQRLREFVTNKARDIAALSESYNTSAPRPDDREASHYMRITPKFKLPRSGSLNLGRR